MALADAARLRLEAKVADAPAREPAGLRRELSARRR